jgi:hypothetical protein
MLLALPGKEPSLFLSFTLARVLLKMNCLKKYKFSDPSKSSALVAVTVAF